MISRDDNEIKKVAIYQKHLKQFFYEFNNDAHYFYQVLIFFFHSYLEAVMILGYEYDKQS